ncbi:nucleotidyl transferase AbiEii/AbiGii toxin family protein [Bradyrhizobium sp. LB5.2]|uniref:nucleotidyl transferase AbiEii/AbiGii toxin family protein n=1 Tax=Bradyrhizobium sp. LB5.2 TaxID=3156329 RepID=UPI003391EEEE
MQTADGMILVASLEDLLATKLKATLDRAEAKDYRDIAEMVSAGVSLPRGLAAFRGMFGGEPAQVLRALAQLAQLEARFRYFRGFCTA